MTEIEPAPSPFDAIKHVDERGEHWFARELMAHFGYAQWRDVNEGIGRSLVSISNEIGVSAARMHIATDRKKVALGNGAFREVDDYRLTRYGSYIWAMNGDPRKREIAAAQTYFAVRTAQAEAVEKAGTSDRDLDLLDGMIAAMRQQRAEMREQRQRITAVEAKVSAIEGQHDWFTALAHAKLTDRPTDRPYLSRVGAKATRLLKARGEEPVKRQDATFGSINTYPADVLEQAFEAVTR